MIPDSPGHSTRPLRFVLTTPNELDFVALCRSKSQIGWRSDHKTWQEPKYSRTRRINADNRRYLTVKATRAGHRLDHIMASLGEAEDPDDPRQRRPPLSSAAAVSRRVAGGMARMPGLGE